MAPGMLRYSPNFGKNIATKSDALKPKTKYLCSHPTGGPAVTIKVDGKPFESPAALWTKEVSGWVLSTVIDKTNPPAWAANYEQFHAKKV